MIYRTSTYESWFRRLKDVQGKARIDVALRRCVLAGRVVGDIKSVGDGVMEMRIHTGPGYRLYYLYKEDEEKVLLLIIGGDKSTQKRDISKAKQIVKKLKDEGQWQ